jgi:uncharacterized protein (DUF1501 family)
MKNTRREFLKKSGCALSMAALATQVENFGLMSVLAKTVDDNDDGSAPGNYRALVCIFLSGGNDGNNLIIPNHNSTSISNYNNYFTARNPQNLAIAQSSLLPISVPRMGGLTYGLHPNLGPVTGGINNGIHELWAQGKMAAVTNVGTLVVPTSKAQFQAKSVPLPYQLFSHSDQVNQIQAGLAGTGSFTGWGGKLADRMHLSNNPNGLIPMITSIKGTALFTAGHDTFALAIADSNTGLNQVLNPQGYSTSTTSTARLQAFNDLRNIDLENKYVEAASGITDQAMAANAALSSFQEVTVTFPNTGLGRQLKQVARMIKKRADLNVNRQIFYCQLGGFDTHNAQIGNQAGLMTELGQAVRAFYDEMVVQGNQDNVTSFTATDFGRTLNPAGTGVNAGSDHAWGNHLFVIGGSVSSADFYGINTTNGTPFPTLQITGPDDTDSNSNARGRWIPTTSVEQYAATLARWYGLSENDMSLVFPNSSNFPNTNLGFLTA